MMELSPLVAGLSHARPGDVTHASRNGASSYRTLRRLADEAARLIDPEPLVHETNGF
jgi:hypothetical protein